MVFVIIRFAPNILALMGLYCDGNRYFFIGAGYDAINATGEEIAYVADGTHCELVFSHIYGWNGPRIEVRYEPGTHHEYLIDSDL